MCVERNNRLLGRSLLIVLVASAALVCFAPVCAGQGKKHANVFRPVPSKLRPRLIRRLNLYVSLRRTRQWGRLYDLYSRQYVARRWPPTGMLREEFVKGNQQDDTGERGDGLLRFKADKVRFAPASEDAPTRAVIEGCAEYYSSRAGVRIGRSRKLKSVVEARYEGGEWYLTDVVVNYRCEGCEADRCRLN
ncbi:MAG TPA: hypothetical protein VF528_18875 [Pyrinomonadaceae bacterium]